MKKRIFIIVVNIILLLIFTVNVSAQESLSDSKIEFAIKSMVKACRYLNYFTTAYFLNYAYECGKSGKSSDLNFSSSSSLSEKIQNDSEAQKKIKEVFSRVKEKIKGGSTNVFITDSFSMNKDKDLYYALHKVKIIADFDVVNGKLKGVLYIEDIYNFDNLMGCCEKIKACLSISERDKCDGIIGACGNDISKEAQKRGIIKPFTVRVKLVEFK